MTVIGLTGGIASGKSTAAAHLGTLGAHVIDADKLGHRVYDPGTSGFDAVVRTFGEDVVGDDGNIDRRALGGKVFGNPDALKQLTDIAWPEIRKLAEAEIAEIRGQDGSKTIVLEAAVLFEAGWEDVVDEVWVVVVEPDVAVARAMSRDGVDEAAVRARIDSQLSNDERRSRANIVIDNSADETALKAALDGQWQELANRSN